jgi:hypothetical protein
MKTIQPKLKTTEHSDDLREWFPSSFDSFLVELDHIISSCEGEDPTSLYRGQTNSEWFVDSTFVRNCIQHIFNISDYHKLTEQIRHTISFHKTIANLFLLKFGTVWKPSQEAFEREKSDGIDPWFELMKTSNNTQRKITSYMALFYWTGVVLKISLYILQPTKGKAKNELSVQVMERCGYMTPVLRAKHDRQKSLVKFYP